MRFVNWAPSKVREVARQLVHADEQPARGYGSNGTAAAPDREVDRLQSHVPQPLRPRVHRVDVGATIEQQSHDRARSADDRALQRSRAFAVAPD